MESFTEVLISKMGSKVEKRSSREEKRSSRNPKAAMEPLAVNLISTMTDIEEDEENFEICERFVLSNLLYHKFLDPDELKVKSSLKGLIQKFKIHAQPEKAGHLDCLLMKYSDGEVFDNLSLYIPSFGRCIMITY